MSAVPVVRLSHVSLSTPDLARAVTFYQDVFGSDVAHEFRNDRGERYGVFLHVGAQTFLELFNDAASSEARTSRFRHFCFEVEDIAAAAERLRGLGYDVDVKRGRTDRILQCFINDPDGNMIELQQHDEQSELRDFIRSQSR